MENTPKGDGNATNKDPEDFWIESEELVSSFCNYESPEGVRNLTSGKCSLDSPMIRQLRNDADLVISMLEEVCLEPDGPQIDSKSDDGEHFQTPRQSLGPLLIPSDIAGDLEQLMSEDTSLSPTSPVTTSAATPKKLNTTFTADEEDSPEVRPRPKLVRRGTFNKEEKPSVEPRVDSVDSPVTVPVIDSTMKRQSFGIFRPTLSGTVTKSKPSATPNTKPIIRNETVTKPKSTKTEEAPKAAKKIVRRSFLQTPTNPKASNRRSLIQPRRSGILSTPKRAALLTTPAHPTPNKPARASSSRLSSSSRRVSKPQTAPQSTLQRFAVFPADKNAQSGDKSMLAQPNSLTRLKKIINQGEVGRKSIEPKAKSGILQRPATLKKPSLLNISATLPSKVAPQSRLMKPGPRLSLNSSLKSTHQRPIAEQGTSINQTVVGASSLGTKSKYSISKQGTAVRQVKGTETSQKEPIRRSKNKLAASNRMQPFKAVHTLRQPGLKNRSTNATDENKNPAKRRPSVSKLREPSTPCTPRSNRGTSPLKEVNYRDDTPSCLKPRKTLTYTPSTPAHRQSSGWTPVRKRQPLTSDEASLMCTKYKPQLRQ